MNTCAYRCLLYSTGLYLCALVCTDVNCCLYQYKFCEITQGVLSRENGIFQQFETPRWLLHILDLNSTEISQQKLDWDWEK